VDPTLVETNVVSLDLTKHALDAKAFADRARAAGLLLGVTGPYRVRLVLHLDANDAAVDTAIGVLRSLL
jgi:threonine aldolase